MCDTIKTKLSPYGQRDADGQVTRKMLLDTSKQMDDWITGPETAVEWPGITVSIERFLTSNRQRYTYEGALLQQPYVSSHEPSFTNTLDRVMGTSSLVRLIYSQGLNHMIALAIDQGIIDERVIDNQKFAYDLNSIEVAFEMLRRTSNPIFDGTPAIGLATLTKRFYASEDSKKEMRKKALDMINLGLWKALPRGAGYEFVAGPALLIFANGALSSFLEKHPLFGEPK